MSAETYNSLDAESDMLPADPPAYVIRFIARLLLAIFVVALLVAIFVPLPETVNAPFVLVPHEGADPIQSPRQATVSKVAVTEGQRVKAGDALFVLRSDEIRGWDTQQRTLAEDLRSHELTLSKMDEAFRDESSIKDAQVSQAESELKFREQQVSSNHDLLTRMQKLSKSGGFSKVELIKLQIETAGAEKDFSVAQRTLQQVQLEREQLRNDHSRKRAEETAELEKIKVRMSALKADLENSQQNLLTIRAPYDAMVISLGQRNVGSVVQNGQELCQLARMNKQPLARLVISESGLSRLKVGQTVRFFVEAYPYQRFGVAVGKLQWISPSAVRTPEGTQFIALASIGQPNGKKKMELGVGMRGDARVAVGHRTLIDYAFEPIHQLKESLE
ncbi:MAG: HlyD family secretion protein [Verrucomicrobiota bacterium]|nr:HlyD family secretion protein [Verrucomicrobiota bacterium]